VIAMARGRSPAVPCLVVALAVLQPCAAFRPAASVRPLVRGHSHFAPARAPIFLSGGTSFEEEQKAAERAETVEYFKTLGGFSFGSLGLFVALTAGAGMEDVLAGNLVLVALCAYGSYLLFFDGGVTQAALEQQAIQQLAEEEGDIMSDAPRASVGVFGADSTVADPTPAVERLEADGYTRVNGALSEGAASSLLEFVNAELEKKRQEAKQGAIEESQAFGDVLMRDNRFDLKLSLEPPVRAALGEALPSLKPLFAGALGEDAELFELAALVSDPRSPRQPMHPDTPYKQGEGAAALTAFIALQDVDESMGPTAVIPCTHTAEAHERFNNRDDGGRERVALLREQPAHIGTLSTGDANLIDSRLIHAGGANESNKRRVLFYFSFRKKGARMSPGSLLTSVRREGYTLETADEMLAPLEAA